MDDIRFVIDYQNLVTPQSTLSPWLTFTFNRLDRAAEPIVQLQNPTSFEMLF